MICVTGLERTDAELLLRLDRCRNHSLQEIRLDALEEPLPPRDALPVPPSRLLIACRRSEDGGSFQGSEGERMRKLESALALRPAWIDLEADLSEPVEKGFLERARIQGVNVLRSLHLCDSCQAGDAMRALAQLSRVYGEGIKLAARVDDFIRLEELLLADRKSVV